MFRGKKYQESVKLIDKTKLYDVEEAFSVVVKTPVASITTSTRCFPHGILTGSFSM